MLSRRGRATGRSEGGRGRRLRPHPRLGAAVRRHCQKVTRIGMSEIVTFGEAMVRLAPPSFRRLEQATSLDLQVGGAELNTAVGLARLGRSSAWVSRLTDNPLGRLIANRAREAGVDTRHVQFTKDHRVGLYFLEFGAAPRASSVLYDRKDAAISHVKPGTIKWAEVFSGAKWFHVTGITPALS